MSSAAAASAFSACPAPVAAAAWAVKSANLTAANGSDRCSIRWPCICATLTICSGHTGRQHALRRCMHLPSLH